MTAAKRILGIDPGSRVTGFGLIDATGGKAVYRASGVVRTSGDDFPARLRQIFDAVAEIVARHEPHIVAIENVFMARNAASALKLGQARAAALCATFARGVEVFEYSPREIKLAVVGTGGADKGQVQHMMHTLLGLDRLPGADAADALAVAVCHAHQRRIRLRLRERAAAAAAR